MDAKKWLARITDGASVNAAALKAGVPQKTLDTQLRSSAGLKPDMVVKLARAHDKSPVGALVDLGLITEAEACDASGLQAALHAASTEEVLASASDDQLLTEIGHRLTDRAAAGAEDVRPASRARGK